MGRMLFLAIVCWVLVTISSGSKDEQPKSIVAEQNPFRSAKMNFIWSKAIHHITDKSILKQVKKELERFDTLYLTAKDRSMKYGKDDLEQVDRKLEEAMKKFDLQGAVVAHNKKMKYRDEGDLKKANSVFSGEKFSDPKLDKLWQSALSSKFTDSQRKSLLKEIRAYEEREETYHQMLAIYREAPHENSLDGQEDENREETNRKLKNFSKELTKEYEKLHEKIVGTVSSAFRNEEVDALWRMAVVNSNFTEAELESIRVELSHFDKHMDKLKLHEEELEAAKETSKKLGKQNIMDESVTEFEEGFLRLKRKLKKLEQYLESRIRHTEL